ncbi:MAG: putative bifunctional diguanylate cyclase/phosphodiesterase [Casimicrobiaceae bacterium]
MDWRIALEELPLVAFAVDDQARFAWLNAEAQRLLGRGADELVGQRYTEHVHPDDREGAYQRLKRLFSGAIRAYRIDARYLDGHGRPIWLRLAARRLLAEAGTEGALALVIAQPIVESEAAQAALERSERQLGLALAASGAGAWDWDLAMDVVEYSQRFIELLRYQGSDFAADFVFRERLHEEDRERVIAAVHRSLGDGREFDETYRLLCFDGRYRWFHGRGRAVRDAHGKPLRFAGVLLDWDLQYAALAALEHSERHLRHHAEHDALTGLKNRYAWENELARRIEHSSSGSGPDRPFAVLLIDIDQFKYVNDALGHQVGDRMLVEIARRMREAIGTELPLARLGGDEFVCLVEGAQVREAAEQLGRELLREISHPWLPHAGLELVVGASIGIALYPQHGRAADELLTAADAALYAAKASGRGGFRFFDRALRTHAERRLKIETRLRQAIEADAFDVLFQPIRRIQDGRILAAEALLRWHDEVLGQVESDEFITVAENTGLMPRLGTHMRKRAFAALARWRAEVAADFRLAVNVSGRELAASDFVARFGAQLADHGLPPSAVTAEITENVLIDATGLARAHAAELRSLGVCLAIDDFGQGYSSLALLKRLHVDQVKIGREFVDGIDQDEQDDYPIVAAIVTMAQRLGLTVVAEGVERESQRRLLDALGCETFQGFLADGKPLDAESLTLRLRAQAARGVDAEQQPKPCA